MAAGHDEIPADRTGGATVRGTGGAILSAHMAPVPPNPVPGIFGGQTTKSKSVAVAPLRPRVRSDEIPGCRGQPARFLQWADRPRR